MALKQLAFAASILVLIVGCGQPLVTDTTPSAIEASTTTSSPNVSTTQVDTFFVQVKYRESPVNLLAPHFEYLSTEGSSVVNGAWYDRTNQYMVIRISSTFYHYCGLPDTTWSSFAQAESYGSFYNAQIKGHFDCRLGFVPEYS